MSGIEIIGLIDAIIGIIDTALKVYNAASSTSGLPAAFRDVAMRLPLLKDTLTTALEPLAEDNSARERESGPGDAAKMILMACRDKAAALEQIFRAVIPPAGASVVERY
ncbi:hypothetical protein N431DRAFT_557190 [Stipitochalara longipes BDJ]|nr:hypothetical protein N431DRAFT_557190 [Stipitochalara longipes BDJ]